VLEFELLGLSDETPKNKTNQSKNKKKKREIIKKV
jgi:hypothetical protein